MDVHGFIELLKSRASHRKYLQTPISEENIRLLVESASLAPSGHNLQPWRFLAIANSALLGDMATAVVKNLQSLYPSIPEREAQNLEKYKFFLEHFKDAPLVIVVLSRRDLYITRDIQEQYHVALPKAEHFDMELLGVGAAIQNILLAAQAMGLGTCWLTEPIVYAQKKLEDLLDIRHPYHIVSLVSVGAPAKEKKCLSRLKVEDILEIVH